MKNFEDLEVWKLGCRLAVELYQALKECRDYGLKDQMTRAAVSIPSNIAEGAERRNVKEFLQFLYIAKGSCAELRTQLYIAAKAELLSSPEAGAMIEQTRIISRMLQKLIESLHHP